MIYSFIKYLVNKRKSGKKLLDFLKDRSIIFGIYCLLVSAAGIALFYAPKSVIPDNYSINDISVNILSSRYSMDRVTINDKDKVNEFKSIFLGQKCRRSYDTGYTTISDDNDIAIMIDFLANGNEKFTTYHFIVKDNNIRCYTSGNTDFIYEIEDDRHILSQKVFNYVNKYVKDIQKK
jgi:hypothetical protein